jgi:hypothetical protein
MCAVQLHVGVAHYMAVGSKFREVVKGTKSLQIVS